MNKYKEVLIQEREEIKSRLYLEFDEKYKKEKKNLDALEYERLRHEYIDKNFYQESEKIKK